MTDNPLAPEQVREWIRSFLQDKDENQLFEGESERAFGAPLIGFAHGADPLYDRYKQVIGPFHWTPVEAFQQAFPGSGIESEELSVISWILPQTESTKADNRVQERMPAERWARARIFGEKVNERLRQHLVDRLSAAGFRAVAPVLLAEFDSDHMGANGRASTWSERHMAHAAGLGTFGLCDGLITPVGKAMRTGSVIVEAKIPPTERTYGDHRAYCTFFARGGCMVCAERCPVDAISEEGHDKEICRRYVDATNDYVREHYGFDGFGCGLCQTDVPCESGVPDL